MNAVPVRHAEVARSLQGAGLFTPVADGAAEALAEALSGAELATKSDIVSLRTELKGDIASLRTELKGEIELLRRDVTIRLGSMLVVAVGVLLAAICYLPPRP